MSNLAWTPQIDARYAGDWTFNGQPESVNGSVVFNGRKCFAFGPFCGRQSILDVFRNSTAPSCTCSMHMFCGFLKMRVPLRPWRYNKECKGIKEEMMKCHGIFCCLH